MQHVLDTQSVQGLGLSQGVIGGPLSSVNLESEKKRVMHSKPSLMVDMEAINQPEGEGTCKNIVPPGGLVGAMCSAGVVTGSATPLMCLSPNINEAVVAQSLSKAGEGAWVTIEIPNYEHRPLWLHRHVAESALN